MRLKMVICAAVFFIFLSPAVAQEGKNALIQELSVKSGLETQVIQFPLMMQAGFEQAVNEDTQLNSMPSSAIEAIRSSIPAVFLPEEIKQAILNEFDEQLSRDDIESVLEWLNSPIGKQFTQLEEAASTPEKYNEMQEFALQLQSSPPDPERLEAIQRLDSALKASESSIETAMNMQLSIGIAIVSTLPREQQPSYDALAASFEQMRPQMEVAIRAETVISMIYTYRSVTRENLDSYISFASSPAGARYHSAAVSGLDKALVKGAYQLGERVSDIIQQSGRESNV